MLIAYFAFIIPVFSAAAAAAAAAPKVCAAQVC
jgi:hypothetical protein